MNTCTAADLGQLLAGYSRCTSYAAHKRRSQCVRRRGLGDGEVAPHPATPRGDPTLTELPDIDLGPSCAQQRKGRPCTLRMGCMLADGARTVAGPTHEGDKGQLYQVGFRALRPVREVKPPRFAARRRETLHRR